MTQNECFEYFNNLPMEIRTPMFSFLSRYESTLFARTSKSNDDLATDYLRRHLRQLKIKIDAHCWYTQDMLYARG